MPRISQAQYDAFLARRRDSHSTPEPALATHGGEAGSTERELHNQIIDHCRTNGWIAFHGSMAHRTFRTIAEPDFIILAPGRIHLIECKTLKGKPTSEQLGMQQWATKLGHQIHLVRSFREFLALVSRSGDGLTEVSP